MQNKGLVLEIQRMSTEDGPGLRTTVFMKGCTLKCLWCHNPESISPKVQVHWIDNRCIGCKTCIEVCPEQALELLSGGMKIDRNKCTGCGICAEECPATAMEAMGCEWGVKELVREVEKDKSYFGKDGGITVSGGEPTMQANFVAGFLQECQSIGLGTALDTCGQGSKSAYEKILPYVNHILFDLKEADSEKHKEFTGFNNDKILENVIFIKDYIKKNKSPEEMWVRTPIIPGFTANKESIAGISSFIGNNLTGIISRWELCAFNNLCKDKYTRLGLDWVLKDAPLMEKAVMEELAKVARNNGADPAIVHWSGQTRME